MKKLTFVFTIMLVLGLVIGAFALSGSSAVVTKADCCCKDSCPLKNKETKSTDKSAETDKHSCCCDGGACCKDGACPMKSKGSAGASDKEHASGDCSCCGDSCPLKSKDKTASADKKDCCEGKESCPMKHNKEKS